MNKLLSFLAALLLVAVMLPQRLAAQSGATCDDAIYIESDYSVSLAAGEYWFMAMTYSLPLTIRFYPVNAGAQAPELIVDFTCQHDDEGNGIYDDDNVAKMVKSAGTYGLTLPMSYKLSPAQDETGRIYYAYTFSRNYRNMLYGQGVTYAIPAYVKVKLYGTARVDIASESVNNRCRDYVNTLNMNTTLLMTPDDSVFTYVWPVGEWIKYRYEITWTGRDSESTLFFITSKDCEFDRYSGKVRDRYYLPAVDEAHELKMTPESSSALVDDIFQTELYVRIYPQTDGYLSVKTYEINDNITDFIVSGVVCVVDNESKTISGVLPAGTNRNTAIKDARYRPLETYDGHTASYNSDYTVLTFGKLKYDLTGITVAEKAGNTDASLKSVKVGGIALPGFSPAVLEYLDIEVNGTAIPEVTAEARKATSSVAITTAPALPGTVTIEVTAEAGNTLTYTLNFIKQRSNNNQLASITVDGTPLPGFDKNMPNYRIETDHVPVVSAEPADPKAKVEIDQPKSLPGVAQIFVTSEAGTVQAYTVRFVMNAEMETCTSSALTAALDVPVSLKQGVTATIAIPVKELKEKTVKLVWSGTEALQLVQSNLCLVQKLPQDTLVLAPVKWSDEVAWWFQEGEMARLARQSFNGNIYLLASAPQDGTLTLKEYTPDCLTKTAFFDLPDSLVLSPAYQMATLYKVLKSDWNEKTVVFSWDGAEPLDLQFFETCSFNNVQSALRCSFQVPAYGTLEVKDELKRNKKLFSDPFVFLKGDVAYLRLLNNYVAGTLRVEEVKSYTPSTGVDAFASQPLRWSSAEGMLYVTSPVAQPVEVYAVSGVCVARYEAVAGETQTLRLPAGIYLLRTPAATTATALRAVVR